MVKPKPVEAFVNVKIADAAGCINPNFIGAKPHTFSITLSLALQHGLAIETIRHAVLRDARGEPLSLIGAVDDELAEEQP